MNMKKKKMKNQKKIKTKIPIIITKRIITIIITTKITKILTIISISKIQIKTRIRTINQIKIRKIKIIII
jgi:hypothetical protein